MQEPKNSAIDHAKYRLHMRQKAAIDEAAEKLTQTVIARDKPVGNEKAKSNAKKWALRGMQEVIEHPERYALTSRKPIGVQEARELVNQMLAEEISFSRFVELINEGGK